MSLSRALARANRILPGVAAPEGEDDPRWGAIISVGLYAESHPEEVWEFVERWGAHPDEDLRTAIATCVLEHLLEDHFPALFPRVEELAKRNALFADTVTRCWKLGKAEAPENSLRFDELLEPTGRRAG